LEDLQLFILHPLTETDCVPRVRDKHGLYLPNPYCLYSHIASHLERVEGWVMNILRLTKVNET
jgi:hypothetical protein